MPSEYADLPPVRYYAEYGRRYEARDLNAFMEMFDERWRMVDHRTGGFDSTVGRDACRAMTASVFAVSPDVRFAIDEVLACDERVIALRASYHGSGLGGQGRFAFEGGFVTVVEDGHSISVDQYDYDANEAMLGRYAELTGLR
ncbi:MAG TPA: nuclear transport factor 2 family protein [Solirubrobacteraceae bacterium]|nr:nuclear transport factor 2 family protein [Solirubrobacteraceae bacterium]